MTDDHKKLDLQKAFKKPGAIQRFIKQESKRRITCREVEEMIETADAGLFIDCFDISGQPIFEVSWGALYHGSSGSFKLYHFDGQYFAFLRTDWASDFAGPFRGALEAAKEFSGVFAMEYEEEHGSSGAIHFGTDWKSRGDRLLSSRTKGKIFEELTGLVGSPLSFYWCEARPGVLFKDPFHDEHGKGLLSLHDALKNGSLEAIGAASDTLKKMTGASLEAHCALGEESRYFTSTFDSFIMKVPLEANGVLKCYRAEWVRLCLPRRVGKKTFVVVAKIKNPGSLVDDLVPVLPVG